MKCGARMVELEEQDKLSDQVIEEATAELQSLQEEQEEMAAEAEEQRAQDQGNATKACVTEATAAPLLRCVTAARLAASLLRHCCVVFRRIWADLHRCAAWQGFRRCKRRRRRTWRPRITTLQPPRTPRP